MADFRELPSVERAILRALHHFALLGANDEVEATPQDIAQMVGTFKWEGARTFNRSRINQRLAKLMEAGYVTRRIGAREPSNNGWGRRPYRYRMTQEGEKLLAQSKENRP